MAQRDPSELSHSLLEPLFRPVGLSFETPPLPPLPPGLRWWVLPAPPPLTPPPIDPGSADLTESPGLSARSAAVAGQRSCPLDMYEKEGRCANWS